MRKKGIEVGINFLVMIIISLVIFIFGLTFAFRFFGQAEKYRAEVDQNTRREIENIIINQGNRVAAYPTTIELYPGKDETIGLGVFSIGFDGDVKFALNVSCDKYIQPDQTEGDYQANYACPMIQILYAPKSPQAVTIKPNEDYVYAIYIKNKGAAPGTYILNGRVTYTDESGTQQYGDVQKIYVKAR